MFSNKFSSPAFYVARHNDKSTYFMTFSAEKKTNKLTADSLMSSTIYCHN